MSSEKGGERGERRSFDQILTEIESLISAPENEETQERARAFIQERLRLLKEQETPVRIQPTSRTLHEGYIHQDSPVSRSLMVDPFRLDDEEVYELLLDTFRAFRGDPRWKDASMRRLVAPVVQYTLSRYFGNAAADATTDARNREFYGDHLSATSEPISIKELKGKQLAVCAEKAAMAQNLLAFVGNEVTLVVSDACHFEEQGEETFHMYNLIKTEKGTFIYDPTNPSMIIDDETGTLQSVSPAVYPISAEQYAELKRKGGRIEVTHKDSRMKSGVVTTTQESKRVYGGPLH